MKTFLKTIGLLIVFSILYIFLIQSVNFNIKENQENQEKERLEKVISNDDKAFAKKFNYIPIKNTNNKVEEESRFIDTILLYKYLSKPYNEGNYFIFMIYILIILTFLSQVKLLSFSSDYHRYILKHPKEKVDKFFFYVSEWGTNAPPVLGVIGTIFAFGVLVSEMNNTSNLSDLFKSNFQDAALTTIIGGITYVINLFLNIFIAKNLVDESL